MAAGEGNNEIREETGLELFLRLGAPWLKLKINISEVDSVLHGGILKNEITELVGGTAVGKTQFCFSLVAEILIDKENPNSYIIYFDTNGSFRSTRLLQILNAKGISSKIGVGLLSRIFVHRIYDERDLKYALLSCEKRNEEIALIVIDSIGSALAETALTYIDGGREIQEEIIKEMRNVMEKLGCAIITTNHFVFWKQKATPSLGTKWIRSVDSRFLMAKLPDCYYIQLIHSKRFQVTEERAFYKLDEKGISRIESTKSDEKSQTVNEIISQNWDTVMEIYSQVAD